MGFYQTKNVVREAEQFDVQLIAGNLPPIKQIAIGGTVFDFPVLRDTDGVYSLVPTFNGEERVRLDEWLVVAQNAAPAIPPSVIQPEVDATGEVTFSGVSNGNGIVGFLYKGTSFAVTPPASQTAEQTAIELDAIINSTSNDIESVRSGAVLTLTGKEGRGAFANGTITPINNSNSQNTSATGMTGGISLILGNDGVDEKLTLFSIWTDEEFNIFFEPV